MDMFTSQEFRRLARIEDSSCVSLLMPTHSSGRETKQDPIRFKNLLKEAENRLIARGLGTADARGQLASLWRLVDYAPFWVHQDKGLAAFCMAEENRLYSVPFSLPARAVVGRRCYLAPLIPIISQDTTFYVLALSPKRVRLIEGTRYTAREMDLPGWPEDFEDLARYFDEQPQLQFHTKAPPTGEGGDRAAVFHGHPGGDESSERKQRLLEYCRLIDQRLQKAVGSDRTPLVLACDQRLASIYREASDYPRIIEQPMAGNPDSRKPTELCGQAWELIRPEVDAARNAAMSRYHQASARGLAAHGLEAVLPAAHEGRVDTLLVAGGAECWGRYDAERRRLEVHAQPAPDDEELLNLATIVAHLQGADTYCNFPQEELPNKASAVAVLRYPLT
jgi:hypothetical protein